MRNFIVLIVLVFGIYGCGGSSSSNDDSKLNPGVFNFEPLRAVIKEDLSSNNAPAVSVAIYKDGEVVFAEAFGEKIKGQGQAVTPNTLFQLGSTTKMLTAVATLQLVEQGAIELDDKLVNTLPDIQYPARDSLGWQSIEIQHLLTHQAGLLDTGLVEDSDLMSYMTKTYPKKFTQANPPGIFYNYSNPGWAYLGAVIENLSQKSYEEYMQQNVFSRLGMSRTSVGRQGAVADGNYALGFQELDGEGKYLSSIDQILVSTPGYPAGSETWSTPTDQLKMADFLLKGNKDVLSDSLRSELTKPQVDQQFAGLPWSYGYGIFVDDGFIYNDHWHSEKLWQHGGNTLAYTSLFYILPEKNIAISIMSSGRNTDFASTMVAAIRAVSTLSTSQNVPYAPSNTSDYTKHEGIYSTDDITIIVQKVADKLVITIPEFDASNSPYEKELFPIGGATFAAGLRDEQVILTFLPVESGGESVYIRNRESVAVKDGYQ